MIRLLFRFAVLAGVIALVKKVFDSRSAQSSPAYAPAPPPSAAPDPVRATAPADAPGPSVPVAGPPATETERAEEAERSVPEPAPDDDPLVAEEEAAAAAEARAIGGPGVDDAHGDPAFEAVYEAGGGEAEGFELAEEELEENATHGGGRADPIRDAFTPQVEADEATAVDGEADEILEADEDRREA